MEKLTEFAVQNTQPACATTVDKYLYYSTYGTQLTAEVKWQHHQNYKITTSEA